jgi:phosphoribosylaminoimidazole-succinocarboxamide synthase
VRSYGYLSGSGWKDYQKSGAVCGLKLPGGLRQSSRLPEPLFTPATKAETGHDENISFARACEITGRDLAGQARELSLRIYSFAAKYALQRGIIIADTKFEFGLEQAAAGAGAAGGGHRPDDGQVPGGFRALDRAGVVGR